MVVYYQTGTTLACGQSGHLHIGISVCMGGLYRYIVACAHLGNGTGRRPVTMAAPLLLTSGPAKYEAELHGGLPALYSFRGY